MELAQLRHFLKVAELGNFTRAAEAVGLSQPALSRSIARLELHLGQPLFERQTRHVQLTDAGELLLPKARQIITQVENVIAEISDDGCTGRVRVAAIPTIAPFFLPGLLLEFKRKYPLATLSVYENTTEELLKMLSDGDLDVALMALPLDTRHLETRELFEEELQLVMAAGHALSLQNEIHWEDIRELPFVLLGETHCLTSNILSFCRQNAIGPLSVERTSQLATVQELVALDHGISLIPAMASQYDTSQRRVYRSLAHKTPSRKIAMVWNAYRFQTRLAKAFQKTLVEHVQLQWNQPGHKRQ